jgi:hypothetical protein
MVLCVIQNDWKLQTSQGYIIRILQHFATKLWNITNFVMLFRAVMKFLFRLVKIKILEKWLPFPVCNLKWLKKLQISQGYIIRILQHFATKLWNITNFVMLFHAMMEFCLDLFRSKFWLIGEWSIGLLQYYTWQLTLVKFKYSYCVSVKIQPSHFHVCIVCCHFLSCILLLCGRLVQAQRPVSSNYADKI